ncbi:MAG: DUF4214 domain-containing protein, partial [Burkholderiales bacterium]|nr:DUF4214 domain-containing protein [Burkholderiales bacterium]
MSTYNDVTQPHLSGINHIDALLDVGPAWNYSLPAINSISYTFDVSVGIDDPAPLIGFDGSQQAYTRQAIAYVTSITGVRFVETANGNDAMLHFAMKNLRGPSTEGLCAWGPSVETNANGTVTHYDAQVYVFLDSYEWLDENLQLAPGGEGYDTLLHEIGHAMGLKHPFEDGVTLPTNEDNSANSIMSYTASGAPRGSYAPYDIAALKWLYGGDGLGGKLGLNSIGGGMYIVGNSSNENLVGGNGDDVFETGGSNDFVDGGAGSDLIRYNGWRDNFAVNKQGNLLTLTDRTGVYGTTTTTNVERFQFIDREISFDVDGNVGKGYRLYQAAFDRVPDQDGLGFWVHSLDLGTSLQECASGFVQSAEFRTVYGSNPTAEQ